MHAHRTRADTHTYISVNTVYISIYICIYINPETGFQDRRSDANILRQGGQLKLLKRQLNRPRGRQSTKASLRLHASFVKFFFEFHVISHSIYILSLNLQLWIGLFMFVFWTKCLSISKKCDWPRYRHIFCLVQ